MRIPNPYIGDVIPLFAPITVKAKREKQTVSRAPWREERQEQDAEELPAIYLKVEEAEEGGIDTFKLTILSGFQVAGDSGSLARCDAY